jgi:hypothetical protein
MLSKRCALKFHTTLFCPFVPPTFAVDAFSKLDNTAPWLRHLFSGFIATTGYSAPILRICTFILTGFPLGFFHSHRSRRFPRSEQKPVLRSRRLHAGHHLDSKQVSSRLIPGQRLPPGFDDIPTLSTLYQPLTCVRLRNTHLTESCSAFSLTLTTNGF